MIAFLDILWRGLKCRIVGHSDRYRWRITGTKHLIIGGEISIYRRCPSCDHYEQHYINVERFFPTTKDPR